MPPRTRTDAEQPESTGTAVERFTMPEHIREELLRAQQGSIQTAMKLPQIKIMKDAGLYEIEGAEDGAQRQVTEIFTGVILNNHARNVLWDRKFGGPPPTDDALKFPACSAPDGKWGTPREGFVHAALGRPALTTDRIECKTCPYNKFGSGAMLIADKNPKGKAITNQRALYIMIDGRNTPMQLVLSAMSIPVFDEYLMGLLNQSIPAQGVLTEFTQKVIQRGATPVAIAQFRRIGFLDEQQFSAVLKKREEYAASINPPEHIPNAEVEDVSGHEHDEDDDLPF